MAVAPVKAEYSDLNRFIMYSSVADVTTKARLVWGLRNNEPRVTAFIPKPDDNKSIIISASLGVYGLLLLLERMKEMIDAPNDTKAKLDCKVSIRDEDNKMTGELKVMSSIWYGKDTEGFLWISIVEEGKPKVKFTWSLWDYHCFFHSNGDQVSPQEGSLLMYKVTIEGLKHAYLDTMNHFGKFGTTAKPAKVAAVDDEDFTF